MNIYTNYIHNTYIYSYYIYVLAATYDFTLSPHQVLKEGIRLFHSEVLTLSPKSS